jgi:hypothetical protein
MFDHNTRRVLTSFRIVFLTFDLCFIQVTSDSSKGATMMIVCVIVLFTIIKRVLFLSIEGLPQCNLLDIIFGINCVVS